MATFFFISTSKGAGRLSMNKEFIVDSQTALVTIIENQDLIAQHSRQVASLCDLVGRIVGFKYEELRQLYWAGLLHDIGKIAISKSILEKPGRLSAEEFSNVKMHPRLGANMVETIGCANSVIQAVRSHHERLDGSGYPDRLSGGKISIMSRIVAVADVFEAMTSDRPYRKALPVAVAFEELEQSDKYDQEVLAALQKGLASRYGENLS